MRPPPRTDTAPAAAPDLDTRADASAARLTQRLQAIQAEVDRLRRQQHTLARLLAGTSPATWAACHDKASWSVLLRQAGFSDADMRRWHADFERDDPDGHRRFLAALNLPDDEIRRIRRGAARPSDEPAA